MLSLVKTFDSIVAAYQGFCNLKQGRRGPYSYKHNRTQSFITDVLSWKASYGDWKCRFSKCLFCNEFTTCLEEDKYELAEPKKIQDLVKLTHNLFPSSSTLRKRNQELLRCKVYALIFSTN